MKSHLSTKRWNGKLVGLVAGIALLRVDPLLGALIGLLIGHAVDEGWFARRNDDPYGVLGVADTASAAQVDLARRRLIARHHPDRAVGVAQQRQAGRRTREINAAYDHIRTLRRSTSR